MASVGRFVKPIIAATNFFSTKKKHLSVNDISHSNTESGKRNAEIYNEPVNELPYHNSAFSIDDYLERKKDPSFMPKIKEDFLDDEKRKSWRKKK